MKLSRIILYLILIFFSIFYLTTVFVLLCTSMKSFAEVNLKGTWNFPKNKFFEIFILTWRGNPYRDLIGPSQNFINSIYLVMPATIISVFLGSMRGYVLTNGDLKGIILFFLYFFLVCLFYIKIFLYLLFKFYQKQSSIALYLDLFLFTLFIEFLYLLLFLEIIMLILLQN
jgi:glucose/mannose transport system permease protein